MADTDSLADVARVTKAWRPLNSAETERAEYYLAAVSRLIRRRYRGVDQRIAAGELTRDDVADVVVELVLDKLGAGTTRNARSLSQTQGPFAHAVTLKGDGSDGDYVLDNLSGSVKSWERTGYTFVARQSFEHQRVWQVILAGPRASGIVAADRRAGNPE